MFLLSVLSTQVKLASKRFLAGSLGLAGGVMLYVSLVEIFVKSVEGFENAGNNEVSPLYLHPRSEPTDLVLLKRNSCSWSIHESFEIFEISCAFYAKRSCCVGTTRWA